MKSPLKKACVSKRQVIKKAIPFVTSEKYYLNI